MRRLLYPMASLLALFSILSLSAQTLSYPNTLLWRITGKQLTKPSYLYGTMHLQDKRLFNFGDSLYKGLESTEGLAIEIDFREYMDSMFLKGLRSAEDEALEKQKVKLDKKKLDKSADSLFKTLGLDKNSLTKKDLKKIREYRINKFLQEGEMPTIVDGYLVGLALRQRKWVGGIEDVADQLNLSDELGADLTVDKVLEKESTMRQALEHMIRLYVNQDLNGINEMINSYDSLRRDEVLIRRNIKMARRMDSLSAIRTMFFAVGAAHLPGDSGVISMLRKRGFTVEPVYSSQKTPAEVYAKKLDEMPWYTVEDDEKLFSVQMPGNPSQFNEYGEAMKMKMFFDISSMTFYMASQTIGHYNSAKEFNEAIKGMATRMGASAKNIDVKNVSKEDVEGREANFTKEGLSYRVQLLQKANSVFILVTGSVNKKGLGSVDVNRFFSSFKAHEPSKEAKPWVTFALPEKAFTVKLPGQPKRNAAVDKRADGTSWQFATYDYSDNTNGVYYMIQVRDTRDGYYLSGGDSSYFYGYVAETKEGMDSVLKTKMSTYKGLSAFHFDALYSKDLMFKTFHVIRGNRVYILMVGGSVSDSLPQAESLFNSLSFDEYTSVNWKRQTSEGFSTYAPDIFKRIPLEDSLDDREQFIAQDYANAISYQVVKEGFSPLYWIKNDSTFFAEREAAIDEGDSILKKETVYNGKSKGLELLIQKPDLNSYKKIRYFVSGDTLYTLLSFIPRKYINEPSHHRFFADFKVDKEQAPNIYINKADKLFTALKSKDSLEFDRAFNAFNSVKPTKDDLSFLHKLLIENLLDIDKEAQIRNRVSSYLRQFSDSSTVTFILDSYPNLDADKEEKKYALLSILAAQRTSFSYHILKNLVIGSTPKKGNVYDLSYALLDSLSLTATIFPHLLPLSKDSIFSDAIAKISRHLVDSGLVKLEKLAPFKKDLMHQATTKFLRANESEGENDWDYYNWIKLLGLFNDKEANDLLQKICLSKLIDEKYYAVTALVKNNQTVSSKILEDLAADKNYRVDLYEALKGLDKTKLFPAKYSNQKSLAESELYLIASDDYEPSRIDYIGERTAMLKGEKKKFYLFKVQYGEGDEKETYLGIAGAYDLKTKEAITQGNVTSVLSEFYDAKKIEKQLAAYLEEMEQYLNEEN